MIKDGLGLFVGCALLGHGAFKLAGGVGFVYNEPHASSYLASCGVVGVSLIYVASAVCFLREELRTHMALQRSRTRTQDAQAIVNHQALSPSQQWDVANAVGLQNTLIQEKGLEEPQAELPSATLKNAFQKN